MSVTSGWGRLTYGQANWNQATTLKTGWGAQAWNGGGAWGQTSDQVITLTGQSISSSIGSVDVPDQVYTNKFEITSSQGEAFVPVNIEGVSFSGSVGSIDPNDQTQGLTSSAITSSVGAITPNDMTIGLTGQSLTVSQGTAKAPNQTVLVSGVSITSASRYSPRYIFTRSTINRSINNI
jgi:hypothetical protein